MADWTDLVRDLIGTTGLQGQIATDARNNQLAQQQAQQALAANGFQLQQAQREAQQQQEYDKAVQAYLLKPDAAGLSALAARFPKQAQALKQSWEIKDTAQRTADLSVLGRAHSALRNKRPDLALRILTGRRDAEKERGMDTSALDQQIEALTGGDPNAMRAVEGGLLAEISAGSDPAKFGATYENVGGEVQNGFTLSPGGRRFDAQGNLIASAPFAPRPVSVGEGETVIEYDPNSGGGDPASGGAGGDIVSRMLPITLQSESRNRDYAANGQPLTSSAGAVGRMQVMPGTNRDPGFGVRPAQDNSMEERARVGRDYLATMVQRYGNPAQAWAAYNAGPGRVDQAIREGGQNWLSRLPQETQAYVRKNMGQLQGGASGGGPRVIAQGAPKQTEQYRPLTRDEKVAQGLNPDVAYQIAPNGQITAIGGQDNRTKPGAGRPLPDSIIKRIEGRVEIRETLRNALGGFQDDFAGNTLTGGLENTMQGLLGTGTPGQRDWWANFQSIDNQIRNDLFGSALTATEKKAYQDTTISPSMNPAEIRANLKRRLRIVEAALERQRKSLKANKYDGEAVDTLIGEEAPTRVRSIQEAQKLAPGTLYLAPDGKLRRR